MTSGMHWSESTRDPLSPVLVMSYHRRDAAAYAASLALDFPPGEKFQYNSGSSNILARIARRAMNDDAAYLALPRTAIFDPAGMSSAIFAPDGSGTLGGATLVYATARDWVRFGELFLHDGARNGVQVLPKGWVAAAMTPTPASRARGYGAHIWINPERIARPSLPEDVMLMNGQFGQLTAVVPSRGVVIVRLGDTRDWDFAADPDRLVASLLAALP
jgi:CubicO group peptidase (beta-lactamase class C family)